MLTAFKDKLKEKRAATDTGPPPVVTTARVGSSSKNPKRRVREGDDIARTLRVPGEMPTPPPRWVPINVGLPQIDEFNRPIPSAVVVPKATFQESSLAVLRLTCVLQGLWTLTYPPALMSLLGWSLRTICSTTTSRWCVAGWYWPAGRQSRAGVATRSYRASSMNFRRRPTT